MSRLRRSSRCSKNDIFPAESIFIISGLLNRQQCSSHAQDCRLAVPECKSFFGEHQLCRSRLRDSPTDSMPSESKTRGG